MNAFAQAPLDEEIYIRPPPNFGAHEKDTLLKLKKSLYGLSQAAREWHKSISNALKRYGLRPSAIDSCLFHAKYIVVVVYVDDMLIFAKLEVLALQLISFLKKYFPLTEEGSAANYLGISFSKNEDDSHELNQIGSIDKILSLMNIPDDARPCNTPAVKECRPRISNLNASFNWNYASVVVSLLWVSINTRPDIVYAVSSAARRMANPRPEEFRAVHRIGRYPPEQDSED